MVLVLDKLYDMLSSVEECHHSKAQHLKGLKIPLVGCWVFLQVKKHPEFYVLFYVSLKLWD